MILDKLENYKQYIDMVKGIENGIHFINNSDGLSVGRYEFEGGFALIQEGETRTSKECVFETHRKYIDFQYMVNGSEILEWAERNDLEVVSAYDKNKDIEFEKGIGTSIEIKKGMFYILFPNDGHKACCHVNHKTNYRKIVVKYEI